MFWPNMDTFKELGEYMSLGIPGSLMYICEYFVHEILTVYAGWIGVSELNAMGMLVNFATLIAMVPYGF